MLPRGERDRAVIHIGFLKTASTTLQERVFTLVPDCVPLVRTGPHRNPVFDVLAHDLSHQPDGAFLAATTRAFLDEVRRCHNGRLLLSDERFSGDPFTGCYNRSRNAERLHQLLPEADVLLFVREQASLLRSLYSQYVHAGGVAPFRAFAEGAAPGCDFTLDAVRFDGLVEQYQSLFGVDRVHVIAYEQLVTDAEAVLATVANLVGSGGPTAELADAFRDQRNRSLSAASRWVLRRTNLLFRQTKFNPHPMLWPSARAHRVRQVLGRVDEVVSRTRSTKLSDADEELVDFLARELRASNSRLESLTGLDLAAFAYPVLER